MSASRPAAVAGVGSTPYSKDSGVSTLTLATRAIAAAVADAGLEIADVDGLITHSVGDAVPAAVVAHAMGVGDPAVLLDLVGGGSMSAATVGAAAAAIAAGQAKVVVCYRSLNARSERRMGGTGQPPPGLVEFQFQAPYGLYTPPQMFAMVGRAYMERSGVTERELGKVAITQRHHASLNPRAVMREPFTMDDYLASPWISEPLRLLDCCLETDVGVAVVVARRDIADRGGHPSVTIAAATTGGGRSLYATDRPDLSLSAGVEIARRLYDRAGISASDVDVALLYDAFTPLVPMQIEDYGLCPRGEVVEFLNSGQTGIGGSLPVNTHGGHLSEGYAHGLNHVVEGVLQLRGVAGLRQVRGAEIALCTGQPGFVSGVSSALLLRRDS